MNRNKSTTRAVMLSLALPLFVVCYTGCTSMTGNSNVPPPPSGIAANDVILQIQAALNSANKRLTDSHPVLEVKGVTVALDTVRSKKMEGGLEVWVVELAASYSKEQSQGLEIELVPATVIKMNVLNTHNIQDELEAAIIGAFEGLKMRYDDPTSPLELKDVAVTIGITVTKAGSGAVAIKPIGVKLGGEISTAAGNTIKVLYGKKEKRTILSSEKP